MNQFAYIVKAPVMSVQIKAPKHDQWSTKQPRLGAGVVPPTPARILCCGPSGSGKTVFLADCLTRIYAGCFQRIYVFSPSVHLDSIWAPVKRYVHKTLKVPEDEQCFFDVWDETALQEIVETQKAVVMHQKQEKASKELWGIAIICDDFADDPRVLASRKGSAAGGSMLNTLLVRGRHMMISTFVLVQKMRLAGSILRVNAQALVIFRLRNKLELEGVIEELSAVYDKDTLLQMYEQATAEPYSFFYVNLTAKRREDMFWMRFEKRMVPRTIKNSNGTTDLDVDESSTRLR
jgi:hypothetical protein